MKQNSGKADSVFNGILNVLLVSLPLLLALVIIPALLANSRSGYSNTFYGYRPYVVETDSMDPTIAPGTLVIGKAVKFEELAVRDIITFEASFGGQMRLNTHRIVQKHGAYLTTQGDNVDVVDPDPVTQSNFRYKVVKILPWTAKLGTIPGVLLYIGLPAIALFFVMAGGVIGVTVLRRALRRRKEAQEDLETPPPCALAESNPAESAEPAAALPVPDALPEEKPPEEAVQTEKPQEEALPEERTAEDEMLDMLELCLAPPAQPAVEAEEVQPEAAEKDEDGVLLALLEFGAPPRRKTQPPDADDLLLQMLAEIV
ncbi:MAG: hypothetical protein LBC83_00550 [Oscillospiraceae bacterium]|jgi:signal peptidase|nr:hypothetical protein [Oscillospiraceae bacterium]